MAGILSDVCHERPRLRKNIADDVLARTAFRTNSQKEYYTTEKDTVTSKATS